MLGDRVKKQRKRITALQDQRKKSLDIFEKAKDDLCIVNTGLDTEIISANDEVKRLQGLIAEHKDMIGDCHSQKHSNNNTIGKIDSLLK